MKTVIKLRVSTGRPKQEIILSQDRETLIINVKEKPEKNKANKEIIKMLKKFFKSEVRLVSGLKQREKVVEIYSEKEEIFKKFKA